jgi:hypothetical protein
VVFIVLNKFRVCSRNEDCAETRRQMEYLARTHSDHESLSTMMSNVKDHTEQEKACFYRQRKEEHERVLPSMQDRSPNAKEWLRARNFLLGFGGYDTFRDQKTQLIENNPNFLRDLKVLDKRTR